MQTGAMLDCRNVGGRVPLHAALLVFVGEATSASLAQPENPRRLIRCSVIELLNFLNLDVSTGMVSSPIRPTCLLSHAIGLRQRSGSVKCRLYIDLLANALRRRTLLR